MPRLDAREAREILLAAEWKDEEEPAEDVIARRLYLILDVLLEIRERLR